MSSIAIVLPVLLLLMFGLGLSAKPGDFAAVFRQPQALGVGLVAQIVLLPLLALLVASLFNLPPVWWVGLMLIACAPGGSSSNVFTLMARGDVALSVSLTVLSSLITVFTIPPLLLYALASAGWDGGGKLRLPVAQLLLQNVLLVVLPVALGMLLRHHRPAWAQRAAAWLDQAAFPALLLLVVVFVMANRQLIVQHFAPLAAATAALVVAAMGSGLLLSRLALLSVPQERTIVIEVGIQNAAQAMAIAASPFVLNQPAFALPALIYALMMNLLLLPYVAWCRRRQLRFQS